MQPICANDLPLAWDVDSIARQVTVLNASRLPRLGARPASAPQGTTDLFGARGPQL
jgi:hypothetical protein